MEKDFHKLEGDMKKRDFQTLNLFAILALLTVLFVLGSRAVLFAPVNEGAKIGSSQTAIVSPGLIERSLDSVNASKSLGQ